MTTNVLSGQFCQLYFQLQITATVAETIVTHIDKLNYDGIEMPMKLKDIKQFEDKNRISISVYDYTDGNFAPLKISKLKYERQIDLLLYEGHYCWIKSLNRLLHDQNKHNGKHFCRCCLFPFMNKEALAKHLPLCSTENHSRITMPSENQQTLTFQNVHRQLEAPLIIYTDFECLTETIAGPKQSDKQSYTRKYQQHTPCSYALLPVQRSIGSINYGDLKLYRGKDAINQFLNKVLEMAENHHKSMNKPLNMEKNDWPEFFRNALPDDVVNAPSVSCFKHRLSKVNVRIFKVSILVLKTQIKVLILKLKKKQKLKSEKLS